MQPMVKNIIFKMYVKSDSLILEFGKASPGHPHLDHIRADGLAVIGLANECHAVNEVGGEVERVPPLAGAVVHGKGVVVVVEALTTNHKRDRRILGRVNGFVVGSPAPQVGSRVDQPSVV